jgi:hypothetical protein
VLGKHHPSSGQRSQANLIHSHPRPHVPCLLDEVVSFHRRVLRGPS